MEIEGLRVSAVPPALWETWGLRGLPDMLVMPGFRVMPVLLGPTELTERSVLRVLRVRRGLAVSRALSVLSARGGRLVFRGLRGREGLRVLRVRLVSVVLLGREGLPVREGQRGRSR